MEKINFLINFAKQLTDGTISYMVSYISNQPINK